MGEEVPPPPPVASPFVPQPTAPGAPPQGAAPVQGQPVGPPPPMAYQQPPPVIINAPPTVIAAGGYVGYRTLPPRVQPQPGMVIVGWEVSEPTVGCCECETLSTNGWLIVILLAIIFWPACFIVCMMNGKPKKSYKLSYLFSSISLPSDCHDRVQRPVYGWPGAAPYPAYPGAPPQMPPQYQNAPPPPVSPAVAP